MSQANNDEQAIRAIIKEVASQYSPDKVTTHLDDGYTFIRPSGNPLDVKGFKAMMSSDDVTVKFAKLLSIHKLEVGEKLAYACYTQHAQFSYKGAFAAMTVGGRNA